MSFVLEAMKKQEADGDPDATVALARETSERRRFRLWARGFAVVMLVNVAALAWVFGLPLLRSGDTPPAEAEPTPVTATAPVATRQDDPVAAPATAPATAEPAAVAAPPPAPRPVRVELQNLPADVRGRFPGIAFSTHVYAEDADLRAIVANGQRLQEGDRVRGLEIVEITESGVVLAFERYQVIVPLITDW